MVLRRAVLVAICMLPAGAAWANVIFPAFSAPYFAQVVSPVLIAAVLLLEYGAAFWLEYGLGRLGSIVAVLLANGASWLVGVALGFLVFPSGLDQVGAPGAAETYRSFIWLSLPVAYITSILVEYGVFRLLRGEWLVRAPFRLALVANTASYSIVVLVFWWYRDAF